MHASAPRVDDTPPPLAGPSQGHGSTAPPPPESDPSGGWLFPVIVKPTPSQKRALKRARRVASGIPPDGFKKPVSKFIPVVTNKPRRVRDSDDDGDSTDSVSCSDEDSEIPTVEHSRFPSVPFDEGQTTDTSHLGNSPDTPLSQLSSSVISHETQLLTSAPEYEREIPIPTTPEEVRAVLKDRHLPASSSNPDEPPISSLNLNDTHNTDDEAN